MCLCGSITGNKACFIGIGGNFGIINVKNPAGAIPNQTDSMPLVICDDDLRLQWLAELTKKYPDTLETMHELSILYISQSRYDEAEPLLREAANGRIEKLGLPHPHTQESIKNLIELYETWKKPDEAAQWRVKLSQTEAVKE